MKVLVAQSCTVAHQASLSMGFSRQEYWSGKPFLSPGDLPNPGLPITLQADSLPAENLYHLSHRENWLSSIQNQHWSDSQKPKKAKCMIAVVIMTWLLPSNETQIDFRLLLFQELNISSSAFMKKLMNGNERAEVCVFLWDVENSPIFFGIWQECSALGVEE